MSNLLTTHFHFIFCRCSSLSRNFPQNENIYIRRRVCVCFVNTHINLYCSWRYATHRVVCNICEIEIGSMICRDENRFHCHTLALCLRLLHSNPVCITPICRMCVESDFVNTLVVSAWYGRQFIFLSLIRSFSILRNLVHFFYVLMNMSLKWMLAIGF